jgi:tRNA threonylcarbamoyladenosine biosynthesis protein TsaB
MGKYQTMIILCIRTDKPGAELYLYDDNEKLGAIKWEAHLKLAETIHTQIQDILNQSSISLQDLKGLVVYSGPGSFTGLRIGIATANALAYSVKIPVVGANGSDWIAGGIEKILGGNNDYIALPDYDRPASTTKPRK